eukprot:scaffold61417_cov31-Tisochrysis_lutea.AAC.1
MRTRAHCVYWSSLQWQERRWNGRRRPRCPCTLCRGYPSSPVRSELQTPDWVAPLRAGMTVEAGGEVNAEPLAPDRWKGRRARASHSAAGAA